MLACTRAVPKGTFNYSGNNTTWEKAMSRLEGYDHKSNYLLALATLDELTVRKLMLECTP